MNDFFMKIGKVISSSGTEYFVPGVHDLINASVQVDVTNITKWRVDDKTGKVVSVRCIGTHSPRPELCHLGFGAAEESQETARPWVLDCIVKAEDSRVIHLRPRARAAGERPSAVDELYQCVLVCGQANSRYVISLYRVTRQRDFALTELCALKALSDAILPLVKHLALKRAAVSLPEAAAPATALAGEESASVQRDFDKRLKAEGVTLSRREYQASMACLLGNTLPVIARQLAVRESTAATYIKRAGIKLNLSGRRGFVKWMLVP